MIDPEEGGRVDDESSTSTSRSHTGGGDEMSRRLSVAIIPDMRSTNPYQHLLAVALERRGWGVWFPEQFGGRRPLLRGLLSRQFDVLHLDWIHPYAMGPTLARSVTRSAAFVFKLLLARLLGRRIVWTVHNLTSHDSRFERLERFVGRSMATLSHDLVSTFLQLRRSSGRAWTCRLPSRSGWLITATTSMSMKGAELREPRSTETYRDFRRRRLFPTSRTAPTSR